MKFRTAVIGASLASSLIFSPAFAVSLLPAGKPAGVKQAQMSDTIVPLVLGAAAIAGIVIVSSQQGQVATPVATTTSPQKPAAFDPVVSAHISCSFCEIDILRVCSVLLAPGFLGALMRCIATLILAGTVIVSSSAFAGERALKPGLPAGVHQAQAMNDGTALLAVGAMAAAASLALIISSTNGSSPAPAAPIVTPTTTS